MRKFTPQLLNKKPFHIWTDVEVQALWDYESKAEENYYALVHGKRLHDEFSQFLKPGDSLIDYGCGVGYLIEQFISTYDTHGFEFSEASAQAVNDRLKDKGNFNTCWVNGDKDLPLNSFDACTLTEVVEHLYDDHLNNSLDTIHSMLKSDGKLFITTPNEEDLINSSSMMRSPTGDFFHRWQHVRNWDSKSLEVKLLEHGFKKVSIYETDFKRAKWLVDSGIAMLLRRILRKRLVQPNLVGVFRKC